MIPFWQNEISTRPAGTDLTMAYSTNAMDFTLRLHGEINFHPGKVELVYKNP